MIVSTYHNKLYKYNREVENMAMTGFDPSIVNSSIGSVKTAYQDLITALGDEMQNQFVAGMADKWACNQAQHFFTNAFKPAIDSLISSSNVTFESVVNSMNSAGNAWAQQTESSYSPQSFSMINKNIDASVIRENVNGIRGIDLDAANAVAAKLPAIAESAKSALTQAQNAVQNSGFIGGSQQANLVNSLGTIKSKIDAATEEITSETKNAIDATVANYSNTEGKISEAFQVQG